MATIKDVAELADVSITTVSHVINDTRFVSDELTDRVKQAIRSLDYRPNTLARSLRSGKTKTIGLVLPDISNLFFAEISRKIEDKGFENGYSVILCNTDEDPLKEEAYIDVLLEKQVDGIIFISVGDGGKDLQKPIDFGIPIVIADRDIQNIDADVVLVNNSEGGKIATRYLIELGHKRIGCISGPSPVTPSALRLLGYKEAMKEAGLDLDESLTAIGDFRFEGGEMAMKTLIQNPNPPSAIFVCNDMMALGAMKAIKDFGKNIPNDFSIIGFDNIPISSIVYPGLTTISQPIKEMAEITVDKLIEKINFKENKRKKDYSKPEYTQTILRTNLVIRESCGQI